MGINLAEICAFLLKGKLRIARDVYLRSYLTNLRVFPDTLKKRSKVQRERKISDFQLTSRMSKLSGKLRLLLAAGIPRVDEQARYDSK